MGEFQLQAGDVVRLKWHREKKLINYLNGGYVGFKGKCKPSCPWVFAEAFFFKLAKTIHRPTESGMVQVWPEVKS